MRMRTSGKGQSRKTASADKSITWRGRKPKVLVGTLSQTPSKDVMNVVNDGHAFHKTHILWLSWNDQLSLILTSCIFRPSFGRIIYILNQVMHAILHVSGGSTWPVKILCVRKCGRQRALLQRAGW